MPETPPEIIRNMKEFRSRELPGDFSEVIHQLLKRSSQEDVSADFVQLQERLRNYFIARVRNTIKNKEIFYPGKRIIFGRQAFGTVKKVHNHNKITIQVDGEAKQKVVNMLRISPVWSDEHGERFIIARQAWEEICFENSHFIFRDTYGNLPPYFETVNWLVIGNERALTQIVHDEDNPDVFYLEKIKGDHQPMLRFKDLLAQKGIKVICRERNLW